MSKIYQNDIETAVENNDFDALELIVKPKNKPERNNYKYHEDYALATCIWVKTRFLLSGKFGGNTVCGYIKDAAIVKNNIKVLEWVYPRLNVIDKIEYTSILFACKNNYLEIAQFLYKNKAFLKMKNKFAQCCDEFDLLCDIISVANLDTCKWLYSQKPPSLKQANYPLHKMFELFEKSCENKSLDVIKWMHNECVSQGVSFNFEKVTSVLIDKKNIEAMLWFNQLGCIDTKYVAKLLTINSVDNPCSEWEKFVVNSVE